MGKTYRNMPTKNRNSRDNAHPYERTRERITSNINYTEVPDEDSGSLLEDTFDDSDFADR